MSVESVVSLLVLELLSMQHMCGQSLPLGAVATAEAPPYPVESVDTYIMSVEGESVGMSVEGFQGVRVCELGAECQLGADCFG